MADFVSMLQQAMEQPGGDTWVMVTVGAIAVALLAIVAGFLLKAIRMVAIVVFIVMALAALFGGWRSAEIARAVDAVKDGVTSIAQ